MSSMPGAPSSERSSAPVNNADADLHSGGSSGPNGRPNGQTGGPPHSSQHPMRHQGAPANHHHPHPSAPPHPSTSSSVHRTSSGSLPTTSGHHHHHSGQGHNERLPPIATLDASMPDSGSSPVNGGNNSATQGASSSNASAQAQAHKDGVKRTKTSRACDPCRRKKIRCDILPSADPPICAHCKQYGFDCTFFLPITETRWKKRKLDEDEPTPTASTVSPSASTPLGRLPSRSDSLSLGAGGSGSVAGGPGLVLRRESSEVGGSGSVPPPPRRDTRIYGPTSLTYILHSSSTMPAVDSFDLRYHQTWRVGRSGEGFIQIFDQADLDAGSDDEEGNGRRGVEREVLEQLVNRYFRDVAPLLPVITQAEFLHGIEEDAGVVPGRAGSSAAGPSSLRRRNGQQEQQQGSSSRAAGEDANIQTYEPSPVLLYAICTIAAAARDVPARIFDALRVQLNNVIRSEDVLSSASLTNIQALLIAGMTAEAHGRAPSASMSTAWLRTSTAIRMAQDLGLHRAEAAQTNIMLRRRLWAACVISDRWYALTLGLPFIIDVHDCDARLPGSASTFDPPMMSQGGMSEREIEEQRSFVFMAEMVKLSVLLGKITKAIYSPTGLIHTTDEQLRSLEVELDRFILNVPPSMQFQGKDSDIFSGMLFLSHACLGLIFWRVFARIQYTMPAHLEFAITVEAWTALTVNSAKAIEWLDHHETLYDTWLIVAYSLTSCSLVQYHTWARRADTDAGNALQCAKDIARRWERAIDNGHMISRRKTTEIIALLYEATQSNVPRNFWPLNPTAGVEARNSASADAIVFRKDLSKPGKGFFIATESSAKALGPDMPDGTVVVPDPNIAALEAANASGGGEDTGMIDGAQMSNGQAGPSNWQSHDPGPSHIMHGAPPPSMPSSSSAPLPGVDQLGVPSFNPSSAGGALMLNHSGDPSPSNTGGAGSTPGDYHGAGPTGPGPEAGAGGGFFAVPMPNYQHPYFVPDPSYHRERSASSNHAPAHPDHEYTHHGHAPAHSHVDVDHSSQPPPPHPDGYAHPHHYSQPQSHPHPHPHSLPPPHPHPHSHTQHYEPQPQPYADPSMAPGPPPHPSHQQLPPPYPPQPPQYYDPNPYPRPRRD